MQPFEHRNQFAAQSHRGLVDDHDMGIERLRRGSQNLRSQRCDHLEVHAERSGIHRAVRSSAEHRKLHRVDPWRHIETADRRGTRDHQRSGLRIEIGDCPGQSHAATEMAEAGTLVGQEQDT